MTVDKIAAQGRQARLECESATADLLQDLLNWPSHKIANITLSSPPKIEPPELTAYEKMTRLAALMGDRSRAAYQRAAQEELHILIAELKEFASHQEDMAYEIGMRLHVLKERKPTGLSWAGYLKDQGLPWGHRWANQFIRVFKGKATMLEILQKRRESMARTRSNRAPSGARRTVETKGENGSACAINWENHREDDSESDAVIRARAVNWQLHEAQRLAEEFALLRAGTQRTEIKRSLDRKIGKVITAWKKLQTEMRRRGTR